MPCDYERARVMAVTAAILDIFEDFLEAKGVDIPNSEKLDSDAPCILYGTDYGDLQDSVESVLRAYRLI